MPLYEITNNRLAAISRTTFTELGMQERSDILKAVRSNIGALTPGIRTMVLDEEFGNWVGVNRRIDLLCLDEMARLVIVELKREDGAHMELQAVRYAAMISAMKFEQAIDAHRKYLRQIGSHDDPEQAIRDFLGQDEGPVALSEEVRIVLAASDFPQNLTTTVLWLNGMGLDIRCVQMRPHRINERVILEVEQVIPLPSAEKYQVALREKSAEQSAARTSARDTTRYDATIGERQLTNLPRSQLMFEVVAEAVRRGLAPNDLIAVVPWRAGTIFVSAPGHLTEAAFTAACAAKPLYNYFIEDNELFHIGSDTFALLKKWGPRYMDAITNILKVIPGEPIVLFPTSAGITEVSHVGCIVRQRENGVIEIEEGGKPVQPVLPRLRDWAFQLGVEIKNSKGNEINTQQLGAQIIRAIASV
jgi:hypothetical protein